MYAYTSCLCGYINYLEKGEQCLTALENHYHMQKALVIAVSVY